MAGGSRTSWCFGRRSILTAAEGLTAPVFAPLFRLGLLIDKFSYQSQKPGPGRAKKFVMRVVPGSLGSCALFGLWLTVMLFAPPCRTANAQPGPTPPIEMAPAINDFGLRLLRTLTDGSDANTMVSPR
jgi:hypothetical protein